jgi:hypothetical protein
MTKRKTTWQRIVKAVPSVEKKSDEAEKALEALRNPPKVSPIKPIKEETEREVTQADLKVLETYADKLFKSLGMDINFTKHFLERVNDDRNGKQITVVELAKLFRDQYAKNGKKIAQLGPDAEAILKDMTTNINVPFVLKWDSNNQELDLVSKTVMRKKDFKSPDKSFPISEDAPVNSTGGAIAGLGVGPQGQPGIKKGKFAGNTTFMFKRQKYNDFLARSKKDRQWWKTYLGEDDHIVQEIRAFARRRPDDPIIFEDEDTGHLFYARYGKKKKRK